MAYNWKYGTIGQRDRLKMIRNGDAGVYNSEKERNKELRAEWVAQGVSTKDIDDWDATIDDAYADAVAKQNKSVRVNYQSPSLSAVNNAYTKAMKVLKEEKAEALKNADEQAESARENLSEWLINNGFSDEGSTAKKEREELEKSIADLIEQVKTQYKARSEQTRRDYFSPFLR